MNEEILENSSFEISREKLYERVWGTPINHLAEIFDVSGSYLARVCTVLNVPRPPAGYWQKKAVGKANPRPELPHALPGDQIIWATNKPLAVREGPVASLRNGTSSPLKVKRSGRHPMLLGVEELFRKTRKIEENELLRPYKQLLPDIVSSDANLVRILDVASALYNALNGKGHRVLIAPQDNKMRRAHIEERETPGKDRRHGRYSSGTIWTPYRPTITYIGSVPIGLTLIEMTERVTLRYMNGKYIREDTNTIKSARSWQLANSWTTDQDIPCGRLRLLAYSPKGGVDWTSTWQENSSNSLIAMIPAIIRKLESAQEEITSLMVDAEEATAKRARDWEEAQERYRREEDQRRVIQAQTESRTQLADIMERWAAAMSVQRFFAEAEARLEDLDDQRRKFLGARLALAQSMLGSVDPLDFLEQWSAPDERYQSNYIGRDRSRDV